MEQDKLWNFQQTIVPDSFLGSRARLAWIAKQLKKGDKVLNIGVGGGIFEEISLSLGIDIYAVDPSEKTIEILKDRLQMGEKARVGRGESLPFFEKTFNAVVVSEVLEHLSDNTLEQTLQEIYRVLSDEGIIIGTVPNNEKLADQTIICPHCGEVFHRWGHVRSFDSLVISKVLSRYFEVKKIEERLFITWATLNWKGKIIAFAKRVLLSMGVHGRDENLVFIASKR